MPFTYGFFIQFTDGESIGMIGWFSIKYFSASASKW